MITLIIFLAITILLAKVVGTGDYRDYILAAVFSLVIVFILIGPLSILMPTEFIIVEE